MSAPRRPPGSTSRVQAVRVRAGAWIAGIGGCLVAYQQTIVSPVTFSSQTSLALLAVVMVAGLGRVSGALIAGVMLTLNGFMVEFLNTTLKSPAATSSSSQVWH